LNAGPGLFQKLFNPSIPSIEHRISSRTSEHGICYLSFLLKEPSGLPGRDEPPGFDVLWREAPPFVTYLSFLRSLRAYLEEKSLRAFGLTLRKSLRAYLEEKKGGSCLTHLPERTHSSIP
jgi:hypothetical protein